MRSTWTPSASSASAILDATLCPASRKAVTASGSPTGLGGGGPAGVGVPPSVVGAADALDVIRGPSAPFHTLPCS